MFKFNFKVNDEEEPCADARVDAAVLAEADNDVPAGILDFKELDTLTLGNERLDSRFFKKLSLGDAHFVEYFFIENSSLLEMIKDNEDLIEMTKTHDLVNGKYEGGFKVWECSVDLSKYIYANYTLSEDVTELTVIELGCGHALPTLSLLKKVAESMPQVKTLNVYLQDYNRDCLELITYLNVKKFLVENPDVKFEKLSVKFVYGDWKSVGSLLPEKAFDLILTSETIYNCLYYKSLLGLIKFLLKTDDKDDDGEQRVKRLKKTAEDDFKNCVLLAAKTYYFGCGGNLHEFLKLIKANEYEFKHSDNLLVNSKENSENEIHGTISREIVKLFY